MTNTELTLEDVFKSKAAFEDFMVNQPMPVEICEVMSNYPQKETTRIAELTQHIELLIDKIGEDGFNPNQYLVWIVTCPKDKIVNTVKNLNGKGRLEVFIFRAYLNEDKPEFECLLKPELKEKRKRTVNTETPSKQLQKAYWEVYFEECDKEQSEMQVTPYPRHYQNVPIGKAGIQILQTINTRDNYVAAELAINNNKEIFNTLLDHKEEIESEIGKLEWDSKENNKSAKIRKAFPIDINNPKNHQKAAKEHIKMAEELKAIAHKYL